MAKRYIHTIGEHVAEHEADSLPYYYLENEYYHKAVSFSDDNKELFFIGRTGSGKSAILEMVRRKEFDTNRILSITSDDFAAQLLLTHPDIVAIPDYLKPLAFKSLWKYIIITNILKLVHGKYETKWSMFLENENVENRKLLMKFDELVSLQRSLTDQVISFVKALNTIKGLDNLNKADASSKLYDIFKVVFQFEKAELHNHIKNNYIYILIDDLDKNWTGKIENFELIRALFECIIEFSRNFSKNLKFVVVLRTDIFTQIKFHQTEKVRPYVCEISWHSYELKKLIEKRIKRTWKIPPKDAWDVFPSHIRKGDKDIEIFRYFLSRTLWRPRDIISFINLCINEALLHHSNKIEPRDVIRAEAVYSRQRMEALTDEWKYVYPELNRWVDYFAGGKTKYSFSELEYIFQSEKYSTKSIVDVLYSVGFLGFKPHNKNFPFYSFSSKFKSPLKDSDFFINRAFVFYLKDRGEELGKQVDIDEITDEEGFPDISIVDGSTASGVNPKEKKVIKLTEPIRVLAIFANPKGSDPLRLSEEDRVLNECIKLSKLRDIVQLKIKHAAQIHDMRRALLDDEYDIVHFSGHGTGKGLVFEDASGNLKAVPQEALAELLSTYSPPIKCVILNACYTIGYGKFISGGVPFTIVMNGAISDEAAIEFSRGFYDAIGAGKDIYFAYNEGCRCIGLAGLSNECKPTFLDE